MPEQKKILKEKSKFFEEQEELLNRAVIAMQIGLYGFITARLITQLQVTPEGFIKPSNVNLAANVDKIWDLFNKKEGVPVAKQFADDLLEGINYNIRYYKTFEENSKRFSVISKEVKSIVQERLGISSTGKLIEDGFIERFVTDETIKNAIKQTTFNAVTSGLPLDTFQQQLKNYITGDDKVLGAFERHYQTFAFDEYQRVNNITGKLFADKLGLRCAIYQGGKIKTSRPFCIERDGKVFFIDEIYKFGTPEDEYGGYSNKADGEFKGKSKPYNPVADLGGHRCRHVWDWISDTLAIELRPDIEELLNNAA